MKVLAVETATSWLSVALMDQTCVLARHDEDATGRHSSKLLPVIDRLLAETGLHLADLDGLACSIGPGSFTGIRVGAATCLGFRAATDLPLTLVPTLEAMARHVEAPAAANPLCPILTSRKGEIYWAIFQWQHGKLERLVGEHVGPPQALAQYLTEDTMVFGDGFAAMESEIRAALPPSIGLTVGPPSAAKPSAVTVGLIGLEQLQRRYLAGPVVTPLYVQRAEAEIRYEQSGGISPVARRRARVDRKTTERLARGRRTPANRVPNRPHGQ